MSEEDKSRRFRLTRKIKGAPTTTREEREIKALEEDDADPGTPEQDRALRHGCTGCLKVTGLFFLIMFASIFATCAINR
jgi:hypothetical protein